MKSLLWKRKNLFIENHLAVKIINLGKFITIVSLPRLSLDLGFTKKQNSSEIDFPV